MSSGTTLSVNGINTFEGEILSLRALCGIQTEKGSKRDPNTLEELTSFCIKLQDWFPRKEKFLNHTPLGREALTLPDDFRQTVRVVWHHLRKVARTRGCSHPPQVEGPYSVEKVEGLLDQLISWCNAESLKDLPPRPGNKNEAASNEPVRVARERLYALIVNGHALQKPKEVVKLLDGHAAVADFRRTSGRDFTTDTVKNARTWAKYQSKR